MGAAPFLDVMRMCRQSDDTFDFCTQADATTQPVYVTALATFILPMLDGILRDDAQKLASEITDSFDMATTSAPARQLSVRLLDGAI